MSVLWTSDAAAAATCGEATGAWAATGVSIDTRSLQPGDLFVALTAARDAHDFVGQAMEKGAAAALVSHRPEGVAKEAPLLIVPDVLTALEDLGRAARARTSARVVAITGSVGKTSTKDMLRSVLERQGRTHAAEASYNNHWGVPLTLARMPQDTEFAVIEIGMSNPGEIAPLAALARPHVAMVTTVAAAHLEAFGYIDAIAHEKAAIFSGLEADGVAIVNGDLETTPILLQAAQDSGATVVKFGENTDQYQLVEARIVGDVTVVQARLRGVDTVFKLNSAGRHFAMNGLAVLAAAEALGADPGRAAPDLVHWQPPTGRGTREEVALDPARAHWTLELIDDAFNANPTSMVAALEVLAAAEPRDGVGRVARGRRIAILGDMLELGTDEVALHEGLAALPQIAVLDKVHCVGPRMQYLWQVLPEAQRGTWAPSAEEMVAEVYDLVDAGDVVLIKGSKGSRVSLVVDALRRTGRATRPDQEDV